MAYTPINWQTGDTITAEKMNKMDNGWSVESSNTTLCEESVTTAVGQMGLPEAVLSYSNVINATRILVTLNGVTYTCPKMEANGQEFYGGFDMEANAPDFTDFPFFIWSMGGTNTLYTQSASTYAIKIVEPSETIEVSDDFQTIINSLRVSEIFIATELKTTWQEIFDAMTTNKAVYVKETATDSVAFYIVTLVCINNGTYEVAALYNAGGAANVRYYNADSANGTIYSA